jgi:hypothetical protein
MCHLFTNELPPSKNQGIFFLNKSETRRDNMSILTTSVKKNFYQNREGAGAS